MDICEPESAALELESQAGVVNTHQMQQGGMKVMNMNWVLRDVVAELIS